MRNRDSTPILDAVRTHHRADDIREGRIAHPWNPGTRPERDVQPAPTTDQLNQAEILLAGFPFTLEK